MKSNPETREIKFVRQDKNKSMYDSYALQGTDIPKIDGFNLVDISFRNGLAGILNNELREQILPKEIRLICPNPENGTWGVFFKQ